MNKKIFKLMGIGAGVLLILMVLLPSCTAVRVTGKPDYSHRHIIKIEILRIDGGLLKTWYYDDGWALSVFFDFDWNVIYWYEWQWTTHGEAN
jgi:hypothetical protein